MLEAIELGAIVSTGLPVVTVSTGLLAGVATHYLATKNKQALPQYLNIHLFLEGRTPDKKLTHSAL